MPYIEVIKVFNEMVSHLKFFSLNIFFWLDVIFSSYEEKHVTRFHLFSDLKQNLLKQKSCIWREMGRNREEERHSARG